MIDENITINLTQEEYDFLCKILYGYQDEGPCCGEGWASETLTALRNKIISSVAKQSPTIDKLA
jgi:hypothetical protein